MSNLAHTQSECMHVTKIPEIVLITSSIPIGITCMHGCVNFIIYSHRYAKLECDAC